MHQDDHWEMAPQVSDYFKKQYKDNALANIEYATDRGYLLDPESFLPYWHNGQAVDPNWTDDQLGTAGYTYPGEEEIYLRNLHYAGMEVDPVAPLAPYINKRAKNWKAEQAIHMEENARLAAIKTQKLRDTADWESANIARTGTHEAIHSNLLDPSRGAYPNAITQMLKGTSVLGVPNDTTRFLGKRTYGPPNINNQYSALRESPEYEQNELLTQALTEYIDPRQDHPEMPENATMGSTINADYDYSHWNMDKPGGPMTKEGLDKFLFEKTKPFYNQLLDDAEKGYVQDSVYATPSHLWGIRTDGT